MRGDPEGRSGANKIQYTYSTSRNAISIVRHTRGLCGNTGTHENGDKTTLFNLFIYKRFGFIPPTPASLPLLRASASSPAAPKTTSFLPSSLAPSPSPPRAQQKERKKTDTCICNTSTSSPPPTPTLLSRPVVLRRHLVEDAQHAPDERGHLPALKLDGLAEVTGQVPLRVAKL